MMMWVSGFRSHHARSWSLVFVCLTRAESVVVRDFVDLCLRQKAENEVEFER